MRLLIIGLLIVAIVIAGAVAFLATSFVDEKNSEVELANRRESTTKVLVAALKLPIGSSIVRDSYRWQAWPEDGVDKNYIVFSENEKRDTDFLGSVVRYPIAEGEPITSQRLIKKDAPGMMAAILAPGKRALTLKVNPISSSGGFILPGDYVDLIITHGMYAKEIKKETADADGVVPLDGERRTALKTSSETFLRNIRVLAVDNIVGAVEGISRISKNMTLEATPKEAEMILTAVSMGHIAAILRPVADANKTDEPLSSTNDVEVSPLLRSLMAGKMLGDAPVPPVIFNPPAPKSPEPEMSAPPQIMLPTPPVMAPPPEMPEIVTPEIETPQDAAPEEAAEPAAEESDRWSVTIIRGGSANVEELTGK